MDRGRTSYRGEFLWLSTCLMSGSSSMIIMIIRGMGFQLCPQCHWSTLWYLKQLQIWSPLPLCAAFVGFREKQQLQIWSPLPPLLAFIQNLASPLYLTLATLMEKIIGPLSAGSLRLASTDVRVNPIVRFNYFSNPGDVERCINGTFKIGGGCRICGSSDVDYSFVTPPKHMDWDETFVSHYKPRERMAFWLHLSQAYCPSFLLFPCSKVERTNSVLGC